jgi:NAD(P)-dependent dehydrogenase (short-subunit alcohol dehydrogenase family)
MPNSTGRLQGKVALITGAASGIGAETARAMAREGARLVLTDRAIEAGEGVAAGLAALGAEAVFMPHDVAVEDDWIGIVAAAKARFGRIDVLVNNAGVGIPTPLLQTTLEAWRSVTAVNLDGVFLGMRHVCPVMAEGGGGSVINISSVLGKVGRANASAYCASKGAVLMLTKSGALELAPLGIRVNSVHPGYIETPMITTAIQNSGIGNSLRDMLVSQHALGRLGAPAEIANGIVFLASDESSFMTGSELVIDGGYTAA